MDWLIVPASVRSYSGELGSSRRWAWGDRREGLLRAEGGDKWRKWNLTARI